MNTLKTIITAALVALVVTGGTWALLPAKTPAIGAQAIFGNTSIDGNQANLPNPSNADYLVARLALGLGTNLSNSNTGAGNVVIEAQRQNIVAATTTPCAIQNPFNATSTLVDGTINITTSTSTAGVFTIATSSTAFATTSPIFGATLASGADGTLLTGETASSTGLGVVLGPSAWLVFGVTGAGYGFTYGGTCSAVFQAA